jgi:hypothetical protein
MLYRVHLCLCFFFCVLFFFFFFFLFFFFFFFFFFIVFFLCFVLFWVFFRLFLLWYKNIRATVPQLLFQPNHIKLANNNNAKIFKLTFVYLFILLQVILGLKRRSPHSNSNIALETVNQGFVQGTYKHNDRKYWYRCRIGHTWRKTDWMVVHVYVTIFNCLYRITCSKIENIPYKFMSMVCCLWALMVI